MSASHASTAPTTAARTASSNPANGRSARTDSIASRYRRLTAAVSAAASAGGTPARHSRPSDGRRLPRRGGLAGGPRGGAREAVPGGGRHGRRRHCIAQPGGEITASRRSKPDGSVLKAAWGDHPTAAVHAPTVDAVMELLTPTAAQCNHPPGAVDATAAAAAAATAAVYPGRPTPRPSKRACTRVTWRAHPPSGVRGLRTVLTPGGGEAPPPPRAQQKVRSRVPPRAGRRCRDGEGGKGGGRPPHVQEPAHVGLALTTSNPPPGAPSPATPPMGAPSMPRLLPTVQSLDSGTCLSPQLDKESAVKHSGWLVKQ
eukprot:TRINITY_DN5228_c0_g1_i3.p2 TRINITY_DN5228_c0_g1~~TRINITY_DN5228_c0_g1_i3.p2  ORF type:complete len:314 (+),score=28.17 TRINITY_DN5228_c0_g1_i3:957-1898(+)